VKSTLKIMVDQLRSGSVRSKGARSVHSTARPAQRDRRRGRPQRPRGKN